MRKILPAIAAIIALCAFVPFALASTKEFQVNTLSGGSLTTGLVSYWNLHGNSNDYYGANNGADTSVSYSTSYGHVGSYEGAAYNGTSSHTNVSSVAPSSTAFTFAGWVNIQSFSGSGRFFHFGGSGGANYEMYFTSGGTMTWFNYNGGGAQFSVSKSGYSTGTWYFIVTAINGTTESLYVNNAFAASTTASATNLGTSTLYLGWDDGGGYLNGYLQDVGWWNKALSASEMTDLYNAGAGQTMCTVGGSPACASGGGKHKIIVIAFNAKPEHPVA